LHINSFGQSQRAIGQRHCGSDKIHPQGHCRDAKSTYIGSMNICERQSCEIDALLRRYGLGDLAVQFDQRNPVGGQVMEHLMEPAAGQKAPPKRAGLWQRLVAVVRRRPSARDCQPQAL
jgi:hypothetical protein